MIFKAPGAPCLFAAPLAALPVKTSRVLIAACWRVLPASACAQTAPNFGEYSCARRATQICVMCWRGQSRLGLFPLSWVFSSALPIGRTLLTFQQRFGFQVLSGFGGNESEVLLCFNLSNSEHMEFVSVANFIKTQLAGCAPT